MRHDRQETELVSISNTDRGDGRTMSQLVFKSYKCIAVALLGTQKFLNWPPIGNNHYNLFYFHLIFLKIYFSFCAMVFCLLSPDLYLRNMYKIFIFSLKQAKRKNLNGCYRLILFSIRKIMHNVENVFSFIHIVIFVEMSTDSRTCSFLCNSFIISLLLTFAVHWYTI